MLKYGLKLWSDNEQYVKYAKDLYSDKVYDYIELYVVPGTYDRYIKIWQDTGIPFIVHCTHFMHGFNLADENKFNDNLNMFREVRAFCDGLNGEFIIFHPGVEGSVESSIEQINHLKDTRLLVENKPYISMVGERCRGSMYEELKKIIDACNVGFCLDIPHAINAAIHLKIDYYNYLLTMLRLGPKVIHVSDGNIKAIHDEHLNIGNGNFDFIKIKEIISNSSALYLTLETCKNSNNLEDFREDIRRMKNITES